MLMLPPTLPSEWASSLAIWVAQSYPQPRQGSRSLGTAPRALHPAASQCLLSFDYLPRPLASRPVGFGCRGTTKSLSGQPLGWILWLPGLLPTRSVGFSSRGQRQGGKEQSRNRHPGPGSTPNCFNLQLAPISKLLKCGTLAVSVKDETICYSLLLPSQIALGT